MLDQRLHEHGAADHEQVAAVFLFECGKRLGEWPGQHARVLPPQRARERPRRNVLRLRVHGNGDVLHVLGRVWPVAGEDLVRAPAEQEATGLVDEVLHAAPGSVLHLPAPVLEAAGGVFVRAAGGLSGPVEREELIHDHLAHLVSFRSLMG